MENAIKNVLIKLGISDERSIVPFYPRVRDRDDVAVLRCSKSGVILLSRSDHLNMTHYDQKEKFSYWSAADRKAALEFNAEDMHRRSEQFKDAVAGKKWLDFGTGAGGILDLLSGVASKTAAVEPQTEVRNSLLDLGYKVYARAEDVPENDYEVVTLFHVLEHLINPIETLEAIKSKMKKGGKIIVEVPHARDFLISFLENEPFKAFTFWSEHFILHTRESLEIFLKAAGFSKIVINGFQRYPLANHLHWLAKGKPGGHIAWKELSTPQLDQAYSEMLDRIDKTDTLIAVAEK